MGIDSGIPFEISAATAGSMSAHSCMTVWNSKGSAMDGMSIAMLKRCVRPSRSNLSGIDVVATINTLLPASCKRGVEGAERERERERSKEIKREQKENKKK